MYAEGVEPCFEVMHSQFLFVQFQSGLLKPLVLVGGMVREVFPLKISIPCPVNRQMFLKGSLEWLWKPLDRTHARFRGMSV